MNIIFSSPLHEFRPVIWYGQPVHTRYRQLKSIITEKLGEKYANLLSEPVVSKQALEGKGEARWTSAVVQKPIAIGALPVQKQEEAIALLSEYLNKIKQLAAELKTDSDNSISELGELLLLAVEVPGTEYVFAQDDKIVLALWGFTSEKAEKTGFRINKAIENKNIVPFAVPTVQETNQVPVTEKKTEKTIEHQTEQKPELRVTEINEKHKIKPQEIKKEPVAVQETKKKNRIWLWMLLGALIMFLILFLLWWFLLRNPNQTYLPPENGVLPPVDTTKRGVDPDDPARRVIFIDKLNVALAKGIKISDFAKKLHEKYPEDLEIVYYDTLLNLLQVKTPEGKLPEWTAKLKEFSEVKMVFNESMFDEQELIPNDPAFKDEDKNFYFSEIQAYQAWDITQGSEDVIVAIIDNGFDLNHPEFKGKIVKPYNVFTASDKVFPVKAEGGEHGTHVAATAVGLANNGQGLSGIAPKCKLMPIQVADENGMMTSLSIVSGILYAIHQGADVVNMSLGMMFDDAVKSMSEAEQIELTKTLYLQEADFWNELYKFVSESDIVFVQAAGNDNILAGIDPGARTKNTIIVSAVQADISKADFSNYGEYSTISAPGVEIYSAVPGNGFEFLQGTSMASPIVAGAAALVKSKFPEMEAQEIIELLIKSAKKLDDNQKIGPLLQIKNALSGAGSEEELVIPDDAKDLSFAAGKWKSTTDLHSTIDNSSVSLYFDIQENGKGKLTLVEETADKTTCFADLEVTFKDGKLLMNQKGNADCENSNKFYRPYKFECVQGDGNTAECKALEKGTSVVIDFRLKKQD